MNWLPKPTKYTLADLADDPSWRDHHAFQLTHSNDLWDTAVWNEDHTMVFIIPLGGSVTGLADRMSPGTVVFLGPRFEEPRPVDLGSPLFKAKPGDSALVTPRSGSVWSLDWCAYQIGTLANNPDWETDHKVVVGRNGHTFWESARFSFYGNRVKLYRFHKALGREFTMFVPLKSPASLFLKTNPRVY